MKKLTREEMDAQLNKPRSERVQKAFRKWIRSIPAGVRFSDDDICRWLMANDPDGTGAAAGAHSAAGVLSDREDVIHAWKPWLKPW